MAVEGPEFLRRKRKREERVKKKLEVNERVEVRSMEEGFLGSWHPGTVTACGPRKRYVRYDNVLDEKALDNLIEEVSVSAILDGSKWPRGKRHNKCGSIRPVPPLLTFLNTDFPYGLCVDVYYEEAWWEGVVFDYQNGDDHRIIFFPELGDEVKAEISQLRVTQDWNEASETWKQRGKWIFLELLKEIEQQTFIGVSVKQIWYDLRAKNDFVKVGDWTLNSKELWEPLVLEVIDEYMEITLNEVYSILEFSNDFSKVMPELGEDESDDVEMLPKAIQSTVEANIATETPRNSKLEFHLDTNINHAFAYAEDGDAESLLEQLDIAIASVNCDQNTTEIPPVKEDCSDHQQIDISSTYNSTDSGASVQESAKSAQKESGEPTQELPFFSEGGIPHITSVFTEGNIDGNGSDRNNGQPNSNTQTMRQWEPISLPEGVSCLHAVQNYERASTISDRKNYKPEVLKHLSYHGWRMESRQYSRLIFRYVSPDGKYYISLHKACSAIIKNEKRMDSEIPLDDRGSLNSAPDDRFSDITIFKPEQNQESECSPKVGGPYSPGSVLDPELCPEALLEYASHARHKGLKNSKTMRLKAQKHLLAVGWEFCYYKFRRARQIRCISPGGHTYMSVLRACEAVICTSENSSISKENENQMKIDKLSSVRSYGSSDKSSRMCSILPQSVTLPDPNATHQLRKQNVTKVNQKRKGLSRKGREKEGRRRKRMLQSSKRVQQVFGPCSSHIKHQNVLSWLIENNVVLLRNKVSYRVNKTSSKLAEGIVMHEGIKCNCCQAVFSVTCFANHATGSRHHSPAANIFLEDGRSLLECQMQMRNGFSVRTSIGESRDVLKDNQHVGENDHICSVCRYGGELILCDHCPSSFHKSCVHLKDIPDGDWFCPSCCCKICGKSNFKDDKSTHFLSCSQCERKYHVSCLKNNGVNKKIEQIWFCCNNCEKIYLGLHRILGKPISVGVDGLTWTLMKHLNSDTCGLHCHGTDYSAESYCKLNVALGVMHECFEPVKDSFTGRDLVEDVILSRWSGLKRLNFEGFYTILLERNEELVSVATVRVYGEKVAEIPLVGTRVQYRRLGMCRILMNQLEKNLMELGVESLVLPAVPCVLNAWTSAFGFSTMTNSQKSQFLDYTFLDFQDTIMCQKLLKDPLVKPNTFEEILGDSCDGDSAEREGFSPSSEVSEGEDDKSERERRKDYALPFTTLDSKYREMFKMHGHSNLC